MSETVSIVALASGRGSNFRTVVEALDRGKIQKGKITALIADRADTGAEEFARGNGIPVVVLPYREYSSRAEYDGALRNKLEELHPGLILTLGYMRIIDEITVRTYRHRIINIHPSLLPAFPGMHAQRQARDYGVKVSGATVHFMDEGVDTGPIILQAPVILPDGATEEEIAERILVEEHRILPEAVDLFCRGCLEVRDRKVFINYRKKQEDR